MDRISSLCISYFKVIDLSINKLIQVIGIILIILSIISLIYFAFIVPITDGENMFIVGGIIAYVYMVF